MAAMEKQQPLLEVEQCVTSIPEDHEATCWGCGLQLIFASYAPVFKCGWCGAITQSNQTSRKPDSVCFSHWRRFRDMFFVTVLILFMLFVICGGVWAIYPVVFLDQQVLWNLSLHVNSSTSLNQSPQEHIIADLVKCVLWTWIIIAHLLETVWGLQIIELLSFFLFLWSSAVVMRLL
ncbi:hypothetical protein GUJ93_ZPchr0004g38438 [Zizania palustris]|uniref:Protein S-acyltransferase n=1 Tax=Zizania palustris TaxID=103762 RepID=A0A8J5SLH1_ZIZPA|nr:hypothetical protein GUJ93_ZPchr0004g38438 [Zizania palustris]